MYLPTLRALFALNEQDPAAAIQALQPASRYDLALGGVGYIARFGGLYPIYVRGLARLAAGGEGHVFRDLALRQQHLAARE